MTKRNAGDLVRLWLWIAGACVAIYLFIAHAVFAWRHPWMTDREVFLHFGDWITWGTVEEAKR